MAIPRDIPAAQRTITDRRDCGCTYYHNILYSACDELERLRRAERAAADIKTRAGQSVRKHCVATAQLDRVGEQIRQHVFAIPAATMDRSEG